MLYANNIILDEDVEFDNETYKYSNDNQTGKTTLVLKVGKLMRTKKKDEKKTLMQIGYLRRKW